MNKTFIILSIDAWGNKEDGYQWNNWHKLGELSDLPENDSDIIKVLQEKSILSDQVTLENLYIEDDQFNVVIHEKETDKPLLAIQYGHNY